MVKLKELSIDNMTIEELEKLNEKTVLKLQELRANNINDTVDNLKAIADYLTKEIYEEYTEIREMIRVLKDHRNNFEYTDVIEEILDKESLPYE